MNKFSQVHIRLPFHTLASLKERLAWYVNLRWMAAIGILICVPVSSEMLKFVLPYPQIVSIAVLLLSINIIYFFIVRHYTFKNEYQELNFAELQIIIDLLIISFLIHYSGGIENPFYFLYIVQVILSGILFPGIVLPYFNAVLAAMLLTIWTFAEYFGFIQGYYLESPSYVSLSVIITSLAAFYITNFAGIYIINNFMLGYRALKSIIDEKNDMLEKSMRDRNKAFRYAAHELKTPVIAIQSSLAVIKDLYSDEFRPEVKEMVIKAENRSSQILSMIKEMIAITQYTLGMEQPEYTEVNFNEWLKHAVNNHISYAVKKNINLIYKSAADFPLQIIDVTGMEKIVSNLVSNALRYTMPGGTVVVEVFCNSRNYGFSVDDNGIGINPDDLNKIFDEFYRAKNAREMERFGTGLGLNLVKEIVEYLKGEISVSSTTGEGSRFTVSFLLQKKIQKRRIMEDDLILSFE
jgi:signal transduction histidine kinase